MDLYSPGEKKLFKLLNSPKKIQDYLNSIPFNFEKKGQTCYSPSMVIKMQTAHCMEGAMLAAAVLEYYGQPPIVMDLRSVKPYDVDHVVAVFKQFGCFGAISKTNHGVLRYREPIYKTIRELALSYFHEYFLDNGKKTLREYSNPFNLKYFDRKGKLNSSEKGRGKLNWRTSTEDLFDIPYHLDQIKHYQFMSKAQIKNLRKADRIEIQTGKLTEYKK